MSATRIGCDHAVVAKLTEGTDGTPTYATIMPLPGLVKMNVNPNASLETMFYDDGPGDTASTLGKIEVEFEKNALAIAESAFLLGHTVDTNGALVSAADDTPPWVTLGFRSQKSDGTYKYVTVFTVYTYFYRRISRLDYHCPVFIRYHITFYIEQFI